MWTTNNPHFDKQIGVNMKDIPAFPAMHYDLADNEHGLTMRDYFAAKALQGFISRGVHYDADVDATRAYAFADAMLEARGE